jgi:hypothetical protein
MNIKILFSTGIMSNGGIETQSLDSVPNIPVKTQTPPQYILVCCEGICIADNDSSIGWSP